MRKSFLCLFLSFCFAVIGTGLAQDARMGTENQSGAEFPLISESDLYCSIFIWNGPLPAIKIVRSEKEDEKSILTDADTFTIDKGSSSGMEIGQLFLIIGIDKKIGKYGLLATRLGRARIVRLEEKLGVARIEKSCAWIMNGSFLIPFEEKEGLLGKDEGYRAPVPQGQGVSASIVYLDTDLVLGGSGQWAIIDAGKTKGLQTGQQMTIFAKAKKGMPREAIGNLVVIDVQDETSTVKILSCRDSIEIGFETQTK